MTLRELIQAHPDWLEYELTVYRPDGELEYVGESGMVYLSDGEEDGSKVIVFAGN